MPLPASNDHRAIRQFARLCPRSHWAAVPSSLAVIAQLLSLVIATACIGRGRPVKDRVSSAAGRSPCNRGPINTGGDHPGVVAGDRYCPDRVLVAGEGVQAARSHTIAVRSSLAVTAQVPSLVTATALNRVLMVGEGCSTVPVARSHTIAVRSLLTATARVPSPVTAAATGGLVGPQARLGLRVIRSQEYDYICGLAFHTPLIFRSDNTVPQILAARPTTEITSPWTKPVDGAAVTVRREPPSSSAFGRTWMS